MREELQGECMISFSFARYRFAILPIAGRLRMNL
jgi:hypothetical protein